MPKTSSRLVAPGPMPLPLELELLLLLLLEHLDLMLMVLLLLLLRGRPRTSFATGLERRPPRCSANSVKSTSLESHSGTRYVHQEALRKVVFKPKKSCWKNRRTEPSGKKTKTDWIDLVAQTRI